MKFKIRSLDDVNPGRRIVLAQNLSNLGVEHFDMYLFDIFQEREPLTLTIEFNHCTSIILAGTSTSLLARLGLFLNILCQLLF